jgi:uncharacterized SAM-binding protein YcdF (DUF218 family)
LFVALSKVLDLAVAPLTWALALAVAAALLRRRERLAGALAASAAAVLLAFSAEPVADALARIAESAARRTWRSDAVYDAVIVLGGAVDPAASRASGTAELNGAADRVVAGFELWRAGKARHLLLSAGLLRPLAGEPSEAERLAAKLEGWGVPRDVLVLDTRSRNTHENAVECARIVAERGFRSLLLVTSAAHMERALGSFRAVGLEPDALPVDRRAGDGQQASWLPRAGALSLSTDVLRELAGRLAYRIAGYSKP